VNGVFVWDEQLWQRMVDKGWPPTWHWIFHEQRVTARMDGTRRNRDRPHTGCADAPHAIENLATSLRPAIVDPPAGPQTVMQRTWIAQLLRWYRLSYPWPEAKPLDVVCLSSVAWSRTILDGSVLRHRLHRQSACLSGPSGTGAEAHSLH
jgi:hypothetical protein